MKNYLLLCFTSFSISLLAQTSTVNYTESTDDFANPERGFYRYSESEYGGNYDFLNAQTLSNYRNLHKPSGANYNIYSTLVFRYFELTAFKNSAISNAFLSNMQADFDAARTAGVKLIIRFAYTLEVAHTNCDEGICPPYGDAPKARVLQHIQQLAPLLQSNADVIAAVQLGFIGIWGENYYTDYFGDASDNGAGKLTVTDFNNRAEVITALLDVLPEDRMIQVRYVQQKQKYVYGANASTNPALSPPLDVNNAHTGTAIARIGFHNDCFLADPVDFGTYSNYGPGTPNYNSTAHLKPYKAEDSKFVVVGGETCATNNPRDNCASQSGDADTELASLHYSYLHAEYNNDVNNGWTNQGCIEDIKRKLGYRFVLRSGNYTNEARPGRTITVEIELDNVGYAAPFNPRGVELVLRHSTSGAKYFARLDDDPRFWLTGSHTISQTLCLPANIPLGSYKLLLNFPDPKPSLYGRPEYAIRCANTGMWEAATGYNDLGHTLVINQTAPGSACNGQTTFASTSFFLPVEWLSWKATPLTKAIELTWATSTEWNNKGFQLQRSTDGKTFQNLAWIAANSTQQYQWLDEKVELGQVYYYRLEQADADGERSYSSIVSATLAVKSPTIRLFPNPVKEQLTIEYVAAEPAHLQVFDVSGRLLTQQWIVETTTYDCSQLPKGVYWFYINGKERVVEKIVKVE